MLKRTGKLLCVPLVFVLIASCSLPRRPGPPPPTPLPSTPLAPVDWNRIEGWQEHGPGLVLDAFLNSCIALGQRPQWQKVCSGAPALEGSSGSELRAFFEDNFTPYQLRQPDGSPIGLATGYYVPDLRGSREPSPDYPYPLYRRPDDLLVIDLGDAYPELAGYRLRGRLAERRVLPYWDRAAIEGDRRPLSGQELLWVDDPVELFFLHIQGSGLIHFEDGSWSMVNYADQNGHPFRSVSQWLIQRGIMTRDEMSMQNIKAWARDNPDQVSDLLNTNPSYVFFRESPGDTGTPPGALGVPLTPGRSVAVDRRYTPLGAPVFLATTWPNTDRPLYRLMVAQDTGGAIKGPVRADFFWGMGDDAGLQAGRMKQPLRMWVLLPTVSVENQENSNSN
ncbi:MAG: MltA domain-containing protein [bacterium]|nr:MltA domain-containing protein [bacterium]MDT8395316.1 MltA domain-containing protein [bacterium]